MMLKHLSVNFMKFWEPWVFYFVVGVSGSACKNLNDKVLAWLFISSKMEIVSVYSS